jgi:hypothetical protein
VPDAVLSGVAEFVAISARLTGFDESDLLATGMARRYHAVLAEQVGAEHHHRFGTADLAADELMRRIAEAVTHLWYLGVWPGLPDWAHAEVGRPTSNVVFTVSPRAYAEGLVWKTFHGHPPGTRASGFGSWSRAPLPAKTTVLRGANR